MNTERKTAGSHQERGFPDTGAVSPSEDHLVKASQRGDQEAFALLVRRYQRRVFTISLRLIRDYDEASEITQEAFVAVWQRLPGLRGEACFSTWLYLITYHCGLRELEKRKRDTVWE
jgi:RNA polymerase sigma-70 factor (ECF subfamily)